MHALYIVIPTLGIMAIAYRYYSAFIAAKVMVLDDSRVTPAHRKFDGHNYYPTTRWVLFGHHFAAIAGAGPLVGPTLAADAAVRVCGIRTMREVVAASSLQCGLQGRRSSLIGFGQSPYLVRCRSKISEGRPERLTGVDRI